MQRHRFVFVHFSNWPTTLSCPISFLADALEREGLSLVLAQTVLQGGWPAITPGWAPNNLDVVKTIAESRRTLLDSPLVSIYVDQDLKNTSRSVLYVSGLRKIIKTFTYLNFSADLTNGLSSA